MPENLAVKGDNLPPVKTEALEKRLEEHAGEPLDAPKLEKELNEIRGEGRLERLGYGIEKINGRNTLLIREEERSNGPTFFTPDVVMEIGGDEVFTTLGGRLTLYDLGGFRSELRADVKFGSETVLSGEYYKPLGNKGFFIAPRAYYDSRIHRVFENNLRVGDYRVRRVGASLEAGHTFAIANSASPLASIIWKPIRASAVPI